MKSESRNIRWKMVFVGLVVCILGCVQATRKAAEPPSYSLDLSTGTITQQSKLIPPWQDEAVVETQTVPAPEPVLIAMSEPGNDSQSRTKRTILNGPPAPPDSSALSNLDNAVDTSPPKGDELIFADEAPVKSFSPVPAKSAAKQSNPIQSREFPPGDVSRVNVDQKLEAPWLLGLEQKFLSEITVPQKPVSESSESSLKIASKPIEEAPPVVKATIPIAKPIEKETNSSALDWPFAEQLLVAQADRDVPSGPQSAHTSMPEAKMEVPSGAAVVGSASESSAIIVENTPVETIPVVQVAQAQPKPTAEPVPVLIEGKDFQKQNQPTSLPVSVQQPPLPSPPRTEPPVEQGQPEMSPIEMSPEGSYRLSEGDQIDITVWEMPELSRALIIRPDGFISFPLISEIQAAGLTPSQLEKVMEEKLAEHLIDPDVNVVVTSSGSKAYYVYGAVASPGAYPYYRRTSLLQSIITAGGFANYFQSGRPMPTGDLTRVRIIRTHDYGREVITKNLRGLDPYQLIAEDIPIQPDDIIYVPQQSKLVYVFGQVYSPGVVPIGDDARVLDAILSVGGVTPGGKKKQVLLIRPGERGPTFWCLDMECIEQGMLSYNRPLQGGDIIFVPQKFIAKVAEFVQLYTSAIQPAMETYLTSWDAWFVHERFSALRSNNWGLNQGIQAPNPNPDP